MRSHVIQLFYASRNHYNMFSTWFQLRLPKHYGKITINNCSNQPEFLYQNNVLDDVKSTIFGVIFEKSDFYKLF